MRSGIFVLVTIFLAIFCCATVAREISLNSGGNFPVVIDSIYEDVRYDSKYFVVNSLLTGGGVIRGANNQLIHNPIPIDYGISHVFKPLGSAKAEEVTEFTPLNIVFTDADNNSTVWKVEGFPGPSGPPYFLSSNGVEGNPLDVSSWFQIQKVSYFSYKLVFCPYRLACSDVGYVERNNQKHLAVTTDTTNMPVVFVLDKDPCTTGKYSSI